jgi:N-acetylglucosaminyldiphosphoundecaprenol N-acetyl-beta-D-mannosaminyltransferase
VHSAIRFRRDVNAEPLQPRFGDVVVRNHRYVGASAPARFCRLKWLNLTKNKIDLFPVLEREMEIVRDATAEISNSAQSRNDMTKESVCFLGLRFDTGSTEEAACNILADAQGRFRYIVTPNVHHMVRMLEDSDTLRPLYEGAWRVFCDSLVLSCLARVSGLRLPVITGSDLTADLIRHAANQGLTIAVIGPTDAACARLQDKYPGLGAVSHAPKKGFIGSELEVRKCVDFVIKAQAPLVFLAVGRPQQEILASRIADHPQARGVGLCIGASIDFLTGAQRRAPVWVQKVGLEWSYRLISDPQRFARRYLLESPRIFYFVCLEWRKNMPNLQLRTRLGSSWYASRIRHWWIAAVARREIPERAAGAETDLAPAGSAKPSNLP